MFFPQIENFDDIKEIDREYDDLHQKLGKYRESWRLYYHELKKAFGDDDSIHILVDICHGCYKTGNCKYSNRHVEYRRYMKLILRFFFLTVTEKNLNDACDIVWEYFGCLQDRVMELEE